MNKESIEEFIEAVSQIAAFLNGEGDAANIASRRLREAINKMEIVMEDGEGHEAAMETEWGRGEAPHRAL